MPNSKKQNAAVPAANAVTVKHAQNPTVGARHAVPERPVSTTQPSSISSRRRVKAPHTGKKRKRKRSKPPSPAATNDAVALAFGDGTTADARPVSAAPPPRIRIGDAMRRSGLDEYKVARTLNGVVDKLSDGKTPKDTGGVQKLLVDVLKECSRHLDPPQSERAAPAVPAHITMVHLVPRPVRTQTPPQQQQLDAASTAAPPNDPPPSP
jgi:hypothetical protein